jgi:aldehyde dehydrogenase (NAD+)
MYMDGGWDDAIDGGEFERRDPATGEIIGTFQAAGTADADRAVKAALKVYEEETWWRLPGADKQRLLARVADWLREHQDHLTRAVAAEAGKPIPWAMFDVLFAADYFDYYAGVVRDVGGRTIPNLRPDLFAYTVKEPAGVAAVLTPWNFPLLIAAQKAAPALAAGCPVVLKPSPLTPLTALELARAFEAVEAPRGLFNVVTDTGPGSPVGEALCRHPNVAVVSFTGSHENGRRVMEAAAGTMKRVALECGGKCPNIVHHDADIDAALDAATFGIFFNTGQVCNAASRLYLHERIADEFLERLTSRAAALRVGRPSDPSTQIGPLISEDQVERVLSYVRSGLDEGARLVTGGSRLADPALEPGHYVEPTIFANVDSNMRLAREEIFGPVVAVANYATIADAVRLGNDSAFGLAGAIWTNDLEVATHVTQGLRVGMVWVNEFLAMFPGTPHGGYGLSGIGREMGPEALHEFQENKTVIQKTGPREPIFN